MNLIPNWLANAWPSRRLMPTEADVRDLQQLQVQVFGTPAGQELIHHWIESVVFANPRTTDPNECIKYAAQCAFVEDIIKALDRAENPAKYQGMQAPTVGAFDARKMRIA